MAKRIALSMMLIAAFWFVPATAQAEPQNWWLSIGSGNSTVYDYYGYPYSSYPYYSYYPYQTYWYGYPYSFYNTPFWGLRFGFGHGNNHFREGHIERGFRSGHFEHGHGGFNGHGHHGGRHR